MKKLIFIALFLFPFTASAQTTQELYISALQQVISLLQQQVQILIAQLSEVQKNPEYVIISPVTEPVSIPLGAPVSEPMDTDQSSLTVNILRTTAKGEYADLPYGKTTFKITGTDTEGKSLKLTPLTMSITLNGEPWREYKNELNEQAGDGSYYKLLDLSPEQPGQYTVTFTMDGKTKEFVIDVE